MDPQHTVNYQRSARALLSRRDRVEMVSMLMCRRLESRDANGRVVNGIVLQAGAMTCVTPKNVL